MDSWMRNTLQGAGDQKKKEKKKGPQMSRIRKKVVRDKGPDEEKEKEGSDFLVL